MAISVNKIINNHRALTEYSFEADSKLYDLIIRLKKETDNAHLIINDNFNKMDQQINNVKSTSAWWALVNASATAQASQQVQAMQDVQERERIANMISPQWRLKSI